MSQGSGSAPDPLGCQLATVDAGAKPAVFHGQPETGKRCPCRPAAAGRIKVSAGATLHGRMQLVMLAIMS